MWKQKIFLSMLILLLTLTILGCSSNNPVIPNMNQEEEIKAIVNNYWSALSNRQYSLAKSYCVTNGNFYTLAEEYQNMPYLESSTIEFNANINWVEITGNIATVNTNITIIVIVCFEDICADDSETLNNFSMELIKTGGEWKLK
ncbi:MAG: hypothetical protein AB7E45_01885 [Candidatus Caldatribacteriota bacterium]